MKPAAGARSPGQRAMRIALLYAGAGALWILLVDLLPLLTGRDGAAASAWPALRTGVFVAATAGILFVALRRQFRRDARIAAGTLRARALRARERELATLMANLPGMAYRCLDDDRWTMQFVSSGCRNITGYDPGELIENRIASFADLVLRDDVARVAAIVRERVDADLPFAAEYRIRRRDARIIWVWEQGRRVWIDGYPFLEGIVLEITERKNLEHELERLATHDQLTGLYNRRELDRRFQEELERARRYGHTLSLLWLDLDHFKAVNDRFGHLAGDALLTQVSSRLNATLRSVDTLARYGGEELVAILPEKSVEEGLATAERLRRLIETSTYTIDGHEYGALTASIGVAGYPDHGSAAADLYSAADAAMYRAKHGGRNQVCVADPVATAPAVGSSDPQR